VCMQLGVKSHDVDMLQTFEAWHGVSVLLKATVSLVAGWVCASWRLLSSQPGYLRLGAHSLHSPQSCGPVLALAQEALLLCPSLH